LVNVVGSMMKAPLPISEPVLVNVPVSVSVPVTASVPELLKARLLANVLLPAKTQ